MSKKVILETKDGIAVIRLNRPEVRNAFDLETEEELAKAINDVKYDDDARVLIITGTGTAFCAGADITTMEEQGAEQVRNAQEVVLALVNMEKPVIAAVNGIAVGAGCSLALVADIIIASTNAKFSLNFVKVGLVPDMGAMHFLPRVIGLAKAKELMFTGATVDAMEAQEIGMISKVVLEGDLERVVWELAHQIALMPPKPIGLMKTILNRSSQLDLPSLLELEAQAEAICSQTDEHKQKVQAFLRKKIKN